jgi:peptide/nickel transport system substrate-binding protein
LKFVLIPGAQPTVDAIKTGTLQTGYIRDPQAYADAVAQKFKTLDLPVVQTDIITMNSGVEVTCTTATLTTVPACAGQTDGAKVTTKAATTDPNIRKAVQLAVDPKIVNDRTHAGKAINDASPFSNFPWDPKVTFPKVDLVEARRLVTAAKAAGWDGRIRLAAGNDQKTNLDWAEAVASQLESVGMTVVKQTDRDTNGVVRRVLTERDYDLAKWAYGLSDESDNNYNQLSALFANKTYGYGPPDMIAAVDLLRTADTDAKRVDAYKKISEIWIRDAPAHVTAMYVQAMVSTPKLNDIIRTGSAIVLFHKAWLEK